MTQGRVSLKDTIEEETQTPPPLLRKSSKSGKRTTKGDVIKEVITSNLRNSNKAADTPDVVQNKATLFNPASKVEPEKPTLPKRRSRFDYILGRK